LTGAPAWFKLQPKCNDQAQATAPLSYLKKTLLHAVAWSVLLNSKRHGGGRMEKQLKYWIEFFAPGSFTANTWTQEVECLPDPNTVPWPDRAYSFTLNKREDVIDGGNS